MYLHHNKNTHTQTRHTDTHKSFQRRGEKGKEKGWGGVQKIKSLKGVFSWEKKSLGGSFPLKVPGDIVVITAPPFLIRFLVCVFGFVRVRVHVCVCVCKCV